MVCYNILRSFWILVNSKFQWTELMCRTHSCFTLIAHLTFVFNFFIFQMKWSQCGYFSRKDPSWDQKMWNSQHKGMFYFFDVVKINLVLSISWTSQFWSFNFHTPHLKNHPFLYRSETFALPNPLYHYDKEMGNEQSDIRFYTSLGEKALFEGQGAKPTHESRADSAYFTISFGDQEITNTEYGMCNFLLIDFRIIRID